jgi:hypothetical protein
VELASSASGYVTSETPTLSRFFRACTQCPKTGQSVAACTHCVICWCKCHWVGSVIPDSFLPEAMERTGREPVPSLWSQVRPAARPSTAHSDSGLAVAMSSRGASPCVAATQASRLPEVWCGLTPPHGACQESRTRSQEGQHAPCWSPSGLRLRTHDPPKHSTRGARRRGGRVSGGRRSACGWASLVSTVTDKDRPL